MSVKGYTALQTDVGTKVTTNYNKENTGARVNGLLVDMVDSLITSKNFVVPSGFDIDPSTPIVTLTSLDGASDALDEIVTVGTTVGINIGVYIDGKLDFYNLTSGTTAADSPNIIRPNDYAASTNEKVWTLLNRYELSFTNSDLSSNILTVTHNLNSSLPQIVLIDDLSVIQTSAYTITIVDEDSFNIDFGGTIPNTWTLGVRI